MNRVRLEKQKFKDVWDKYDTQTDRYYSRIAGGVGWSSEDKPGAITVWGEELMLSPIRKPKIFWLAEFESHSISELVGKAIFFSSDLCVDPIIAQRDHADYLLFRNKEARELREPEIYFQQPQKADESLEYFLAIINDLLKSTNKRLHLGTNSRLPGLLQQMTENVSGLSVKDEPLLASCGYVIAAMSMAPHHAFKYDSKPDRVETDYDLFRNFRR